jgi:membrane-associated protease RseP (regulator of RpoE activity)
MLAILAPILVFGLVIFVHELGHFLAAKATGVYAPRFSIGFGPSLWRRRYGETEYILALLPLGGYVRMASRHDEEIAFLEGGSEEKTCKDRRRAGLRSECDDPVRTKARSGASVVREQASAGAIAHHDRRRRDERAAGARRGNRTGVLARTHHLPHLP